MYKPDQDYRIINSNTPVLTRQADGHFEPTDCYLLEFTVNTDNETIQKIAKLCMPFDFKIAVPLAISKHRAFPNNIQRLFLLGSSDIISNKFRNPDDFLAFALCDDRKKRTKIQYFEVNYTFRHSYEPDQKFIRVGTSAADALKEIYKTRELYGKSASDALKFWLKNDFLIVDERKLYIRWNQR